MHKLGLLAGVVVAAVGMTFSLGGCGKSEPAAPTSGTGSAKTIRMADIIFQEDEFFRLIRLGMKDAAKKNNVELHDGQSMQQPDKEFQLVQTYTAQKVDAIIICPLSSKGSVAALKQANDAGVAVVTANTSIAADFPVADVECSNADLGEQTGKAAVKYIQDKLGGKANIGILAFKVQLAEQSDARTGGFKKQVLQLPGVKIVAEQDAWETGKALKTAGDILIANPDIDILYGANEGGTTGSVLAVKAANKAGKVAVFGTDVSAQALDFLLSSDNILQAVTAQKPFEMGQQSVEMALKALRHETFDKTLVLNGVCLTRTDPDAVKAFSQQLKTWAGSGN